jgi:hypothetical protein
MNPGGDKGDPATGLEKGTRRRITRENWWPAYHSAVAIGDVGKLEEILSIAYQAIRQAPCDVDANLLAGAIERDLGLVRRWRTP